MKRYLMAALMVVSAPLFAMQQEETASNEQETATIDDYLGFPCFALFAAARMGAQDMLEQFDHAVAQHVTDKKALTIQELAQENAELRRQLQEAQDEVYAVNCNTGKQKKK